ncbi:hypothetical protein [Flavobacterium sp.]|uniref:hypothetical protein n=1 Tax=Flavobacterium sp. TaxID=239 RepID=UPI0040482436
MQSITAQKNTSLTFIKKDSILGIKQSIFIDFDKESVYYDEIKKFGFSDTNSQEYEYSLQYLKENNQNIKTSQPILPWQKWVKLHQYKNEFYVYHPCDFISHYGITINDSLFIEYTAEGPVANKVIQQHQINDTTFELKLTGIYNVKRTLTVYIIDKVKGIAIFKETISNGETYYYFMIATEKMNSVPIIVNNCEMNKQIELTFDSIDTDVFLEKINE